MQPTPSVHFRSSPGLPLFLDASSTGCGTGLCCALQEMTAGGPRCSVPHDASSKYRCGTHRYRGPCVSDSQVNRTAFSNKRHVLFATALACPVLLPSRNTDPRPRAFLPPSAASPQCPVVLEPHQPSSTFLLLPEHLSSSSRPPQAQGTPPTPTSRSLSLLTVAATILNLLPKSQIWFQL